MRWIPTLLTLCLVGCSGEAVTPSKQESTPPTTAAIPAELWPEGAVALIVIPSAERLEEALLEAGALFTDEPAPFPTDGAELLALAGAAGDLTQLDPSRPIAVALLMQPGPTPAFVLPVRDGERFRAPLAGSDTPVHLVGDYALVGAAPGDGTAGLAADLPDGLLVLRLDMAALGPLVAPMIDPLLASTAVDETVPGFDMGGLMESFGALAREFIASSRTLDLALGWEDGRLIFDGHLALVPESSLAEWIHDGPTGAAELARSIDPDASMMFAGGLDPSVLRAKLLPWAHELFKAYPEPLRESLRTSLEQLETQYDLVGRAFAGSQHFGKDGLRYTYLLDPDNAEAVMESLVSSFCSTPFLGNTEAEAQRSEEDGIHLIRVPVVFDAEALAATLGESPDELDAQEFENAMQGVFGEGLELVVGRRDGYVAAQVGTGPGVRETLDRARAGGPPPPPLMPLLTEFGDANPLFVGRLDVASMLRGAMEVASEMLGEDAPEVPAGAPVELTFFAAGKDQSVRFGFRFDMAAMARLVEAMDR